MNSREINDSLRYGFGLRRHEATSMSFRSNRISDNVLPFPGRGRWLRLTRRLTAGSDRSPSGDVDAGPRRQCAAGARHTARYQASAVRRSPAGNAGSACRRGHFRRPDERQRSRRFVRREIDWIEVPLREQRPFLGICLGAQMLAKQLGAPVAPHHEGRVEIGYYPIRPTAAGLASARTGRITSTTGMARDFELPRRRRTAGRRRRLSGAGVPVRPCVWLPVSSRCDLRDDASLDHARLRAHRIAGRAGPPSSLRRSRGA